MMLLFNLRIWIKNSFGENNDHLYVNYLSNDCLQPEELIFKKKDKQMFFLTILAFIISPITLIMLLCLGALDYSDR